MGQKDKCFEPCFERATSMIWLTFEKPFDLFEVEKSLCKFPEYLDWNLARKKLSLLFI